MHTNHHYGAMRRLAILGLLGALTVPAIGTAAPTSGPMPSQPASDDCAESTATLEIDTLNGDVYLVDEAGSMTLVSGEIPIYFGSQSRVLLNLNYTVGEWEVEISPEGGTTQTFETSGGSLRYFIEPNVEQYVFSSTAAQSSASAMASMAPIPPGDIIILSKPTCPPG